MMKVVIVGPGAMGCLFAGYFAKKNQHEIWILDNNARRAKKLKENGIKIETEKGSFSVKINATARAADIKAPDLLIISVKSYDTEEALKAIEPVLTKDSRVLTLQNGLGNIEMMSEIVGSDRVLGGVTSHGATLLGEGYTRHAGIGDTVIGNISGKLTVSMRPVRELFNLSGFATRLTKDVNSVIWSKLIINAGINAISALTRLRNGALIESQGTREVVSMAVTEAVRLAKRKRIKLVYEDPIAKVESVCRATASNLSSMLQDVLKKRRTEIDYINGAIVRQAKSLSILTPTNVILTDLVKSIESAYSKQV
ncbi:MAG: 2-dehydropantoate 2-reductase [Candidatus Omnitrophica bacterium]|nr:2-dehydropantoate 2-reductase [Candidatus Omnitrophota bacterium]